MSTHESTRKQSPRSEVRGKPARSHNLITWLAMASCALALTACGGGEAGADAPQGPGGAPSTDPGSTPGERVVAPTITVAPASVAVSAGNWAQFSVVASGTAPLAYRWFRDAQVIVDANADTLQLLAEGSISETGQRITVEVSNAAGKVVSEAALLTMAVVPGVTAPVAAATGAVLTQGDPDTDAALILPAGALASDTTITFRTEQLVVAGLPAGMVSVGGLMSIGPADLVLTAPASLSLPSPDELPEGSVLGVLEFPTGGAQVAGVRHGTGMKSIQAARVQAAAAKPYVRCVRSQDTVNGAIQVDVNHPGQYALGAVRADQCDVYGTSSGSGTLKPGSGSSTVPCSPTDWATVVEWRDWRLGEGRLQASRHVFCHQYGPDHVNIYDGVKGSGQYHGSLNVDLRVSASGPATNLKKNFEVSIRAYVSGEGGPGAADLTSKVPIRVAISCTGKITSAKCTGSDGKPLYIDFEVSPSAKEFSDFESGWSNTKSIPAFFDWRSPAEIEAQQKSGSAVKTWPTAWETFSIGVTYQIQQPHGSINAGQWDGVIREGKIPDIRCDNGLEGELTGILSQGTTAGCVFPNSPAILNFTRPNANNKESIAHIILAQANKSPGAVGQAPLRRSWMPGLQNANRNAACELAGSIINTPGLAQYSANCTTSQAGCSCDEYPFATTWDGAHLNKAKTSAMYIRATDNSSSGSSMGGFLRRERVLDFTPKSVGIGASPQAIQGESFWVDVVPKPKPAAAE